MPLKFNKEKLLFKITPRDSELTHALVGALNSMTSNQGHNQPQQLAVAT